MTWDGANNRIVLTDGAAYQEVGGEMTSSASAAIKNVSESDSTIVLDGKTLSLTGYRINGNNYYKIRDVGSALGFSVDFDPETEIVLIGSANAGQDDTQDDPKDETPITNAASYTFNGSGWGHSVGMSQWGAYGMAQQGFGYEDILKFYFTGIEIAG